MKKFIILFISIMPFVGCGTDTVRSFREYEQPFGSGVIAVQIFLKKGQIKGELTGYATLQIASDQLLGKVEVESLLIEDGLGDVLFAVESKVLSGEEVLSEGKAEYFYYYHFDEKDLPFEVLTVSGAVSTETKKGIETVPLKGVIQTVTQKRNAFISRF